MIIMGLKQIKGEKNMALVHLQPWRDIDTLNQRIHRLFDDVLPDIPSSFAPAAEISEQADTYQLKVEVPGIEVNDLDIQVSKDVVSISGERKQELNSSENGVTKSEFRYGKFKRVIPLPGEIQNDKVVASYNNGILSLTLPKTEAVKNKVVKVKVN